MPRRPALLALAAASLVSLLAGADPAAPVTPASLGTDALVARAIAAEGGRSSLLAIQSLRVTAKLRSMGGGFEADLDWAEERPGMIRSEFTLQGLTEVSAADGKGGWQVRPFEGRRTPSTLSADDLKALEHEAEIEGPLVDWRTKGNCVESLGTEDVDGTKAYALELRRKDGDLDRLDYDPDYFLLIRDISQRYVRGAEEVTESQFGDYRRVAGVWMPFSIESGRKGGPLGTRIEIQRIEANVPIDDALFRFPAPGTRVERAILPSKEPASEAIAGTPPPPPAAPPVFDDGVISGLGARNIGSARMSGRVSAVAAVAEGDKTTVYVGAASGGVWKSTDGGTTFKPIFDREPVQSIGAIAIDPNHHETVWVGTGESWTRNSVSIGDGIYRSDDGGENWTHLGLPESERIAKIVVSPRDSDVVYACVPGKLWSDSKDRGLYRTTDGGKSWSLILAGANLSTGCSGVSLDPKEPNIVFAGLWDFRREGWTFRSGGDGPDARSGSGLFRSADGGAHWTRLDDKSTAGLPAAPWGRVEVLVAPSDGRIVYALVESPHTALYRSADGGKSWERRDDSQSVVWRPFYFARLVVDPTNPDRLFKPDLGLVVSTDGGKSFSPSGGGSHGDWHDLWIDPRNPDHVIGGDDGGLWLSADGGNRWWKCDNLPISQFYHVAVDDQDPYLVYGGLQDNGSWSGPSSHPGGIGNSAWHNIGGGDGFWALPDPADPNIAYTESQGGYLVRVDRRSGNRRDIQPRAGYHEKLRYNWNAPIAASPTQKGTIYLGAQLLFRSRDRGDSWERISPDLTTNDPDEQKQEESGGVTVDNSSAEMHTTIYSISESPKDPRLIWVGTDDGNLQLTRDGGKRWTNLVGNVPGLPARSWVSWVEASRFDGGTAYAAFDRHTSGDMAPWVYRTSDFGKSWTRIVAPEQGVRGYAQVIKEDSVDRSLLFLGTELGLWISIDGGGHWAAFEGSNFPAVAVRDLQVQQHENDLVVATHGRGIWILDDLTPLRGLSQRLLSMSVAFLPGRPAEQRMPADGGWVEGDAHFIGPNPTGDAVIDYYQSSRSLFGPTRIDILDPHGKLIDHVPATNRRGINRVYWSMRLPPPRVPRAAQVAGSSLSGPRLLPGLYTVRLTRGGETIETTLEVRPDRRERFSLADHAAQLDALLGVGTLFGQMSNDVDRIDLVQGAARARAATVGAADPLAGSLRALDQATEALRGKIVATKEGGAITGELRIREYADDLYGAIASWDGRPAPYLLDRLNVLERELGDVTKGLDALLATSVPPINRALAGKGLAPLPTEPPTAPTAGDGLDPDELDALSGISGTLGRTVLPSLAPSEQEDDR